MASVSKNMTPLRRVRSSFLPRLGNVAGLAQLRPELEILTAKIQKKKTSQMLVSKFPSNHHNLDGLDFSRYKKNTWPFYGYLSHQSKSNSVVFFQKSGRQLKKNRNPPPTKKHVLDTVPSTLETCWSKSQNAHAHLLTFFVHRGLGPSVWVNGICRGILVPKECLEACLQQKKGSRMTFD